MITRHDPPRKTEARITLAKDLPQEDHCDSYRGIPLPGIITLE
jgi:hypothetical protein